MTRFGRYEALEELGSGAMGKVWLAKDPLIDRMVAIKVIRADLLEPAERDEFLGRFRLEVRAAARCAHPNIVAVHDFADHEAMPYIVMEHVPGRTLSAIFRGDPAARAAAVPELTAAMLGVLEGLHAAHALGVIHRDIKPGNIMITPRGQVKITDFGIAKFGGGELTQVGGVVGTPAYMSPEQARGEPVDPRADLFSVAAMLYEIQLGRAPFAGSSITETLLRLTSPDPAELGAFTATPMGAVLRRGLAKNREERFASAAAFAEALRVAIAPERHASPMPEAARPAGSPIPPDDPRRRLSELRQRIASPVPPLARPKPPAPAPVPPLPVSSAPVSAAPVSAAPGPAAPGPAAPGTAGAGFALTRAQNVAAQEALAFVVGPIARILVMKAATRADSAAAFVELLAAHASGAEAAALRRKLASLF